MQYTASQTPQKPEIIHQWMLCMVFLFHVKLWHFHTISQKLTYGQLLVFLYSYIKY